MTSAVAAGLAVSLGIRLAEADDQAKPERILLDTITGLASKTTLQPKPACPGCTIVPHGTPVIRASREVGTLVSEWPSDAMIMLSEAVLVGHRLPGQKQELVFKRASDFDDSYAAKLSDNPGSVELEVRDQFTADEFFSRFSQLRVPTKYAAVQMDGKTVIFEFRSEK